MGGTQQSREVYNVTDAQRVVEEAERTLSIFNRTMAIVVLIG
jgi:hypothetical protein